MIAAFDDHSQIVAGPKGQPAYWRNDGVRSKAQADALSERGDAENSLGETKGGAGANAGADAERDIRVPDAKLRVLR